MDDGTVLVAYLHPNHVSHSFSDSLMRLVAWDAAHEGRVVRTGGPLIFRCGAGGLVEARNQVAAHFLDKTDAEWLWCVDSDMGFAPDTVERLVQSTGDGQRRVIGGLCFGLRETSSDGLQGWVTVPFPTIFGWGRKEKDDGEFGFAMRPDYPINTLTQVAGTGSACILIHRSVLEAVRTKHGETWYDRVRYESGTIVSEDLSFCYRVSSLEIPIFVHTGVRTTHNKEIWLGESEYWRSRTMPPAEEEVAVIVPVMKRPQNAEPFMRSLRASTGLATVYAIVDDFDVDTLHAWEDAGAQVIVRASSVQNRPGTFAEKVNIGYGHTSQPWLLLVGDDVTFHPGWLDHAQHIAKTLNAAVIGTNDLGNPRVTSGEHAVHMLIRRDYIDELGASWDGPKVVAHEGYQHWYVDDEIVLVAKQRGQFTMAIGSVIEHLHPLFGKAKVDDVYERGEASAAADRKVFEARIHKYA